MSLNRNDRSDKMSSVNKPVSKHDLLFILFVLCSLRVLLAYPNVCCKVWGVFGNKFWKFNVGCSVVSYGGRYVKIC